MELSNQEKELLKIAKSLVGFQKIRGGSIKEVGCALVTASGKIFSGANLDLYCGIGFCAEHSAASQMLSQSGETHIKTIVAVNKDSPIPPCGRCREMMNQLDRRNKDTEIIIAEDKKVKLSDLLPYAWEIEQNRPDEEHL